METFPRICGWSRDPAAFHYADQRDNANGLVAAALPTRVYDVVSGMPRRTKESSLAGCRRNPIYRAGGSEGPPERARAMDSGGFCIPQPSLGDFLRSRWSGSARQSCHSPARAGTLPHGPCDSPRSHWFGLITLSTNVCTYSPMKLRTHAHENPRTT